MTIVFTRGTLVGSKTEPSLQKPPVTVTDYTLCCAFNVTT